jgi:RNA polymerase sigma factor (sigma-70 family)
VAQLRRGDAGAVEALVGAYGDRAYRLDIRITGNASDAEEVVQDALWAASRKIDTFRGTAAFGSWLYRVTANAAYQKLRGRRSKRNEVSWEDLAPAFDEQGQHAEVAIDWSRRLKDPAIEGELKSVLGGAIDELPATYALRPLVVISIVDQVVKDPGYHLQVADIERWEARQGKIPQGSVVMVRSDWSKDWPNPKLASQKVFPGVSLDALKFLHLQRRILFHGHEPLDTDTTAKLEGEYWLMHNGYAQAEGVANLDKVAEKGCLVTIGYPKFAGGLGGYARYVAICPSSWKYGISVGAVAEAPLPKSDKILRWSEAAGMRVRQ